MFKIAVACAVPGLISWNDGRTSGSIQESQCLNKHRLHWNICLNVLQIWTFVTISSHLGTYNNSGVVNSWLLICIFFFLPWEAKKRKNGNSKAVSLLVSLWDAPEENSSLTPINSCRGSADFEWNMKSHWDRNNSFMPVSVLNTSSNSRPGLLPGLFRNNKTIILSTKLGRLSTKKAKHTLHLLQFYPLFSLTTHSFLL